MKIAGYNAKWYEHVFLLVGSFSATVAINDRTYSNNQAFSLEQKRQLEEVGRIEKMEVRYLGFPNDVTLVMNKGLSTPYECAQRKCIQY